MFCLYTPCFYHHHASPGVVSVVWQLDSRQLFFQRVPSVRRVVCERQKMRRVLCSSRADLRTCDYDLCSSLRRRPDAAGIQLPGYSAALGTEPHLTRVLLYYSHWHESNFRLRALSAYHVLLSASPTVWAASDGSVINLWRVSHKPSAGLSCW